MAGNTITLIVPNIVVFGARFADTIRSKWLPKDRTSLGASARDTGPLISSKSEFWLVISAHTAGKPLRGGWITPGELERRTGLQAVRLSRHEI